MTFCQVDLFYLIIYLFVNFSLPKNTVQDNKLAYEHFHYKLNDLIFFKIR